MRWRLTLTYVGLLAVLLAGFGAYQYVSLRASLIASRVSSLQDDMTTARALLAKATGTAARGRALCATTAGVQLVGRAVVTTVATTSGHTVAVIVYDRSARGHRADRWQRPATARSRRPEPRAHGHAQ